MLRLQTSSTAFRSLVLESAAFPLCFPLSLRNHTRSVFQNVRKRQCAVTRFVMHC